MAKFNLSVADLEALIHKNIHSAVYSALETKSYKEIDEAEWRNLRQINTLYSRQLDAIRTIANWHMRCTCDAYELKYNKHINCNKHGILDILAREE